MEGAGPPGTWRVMAVPVFSFSTRKDRAQQEAPRRGLKTAVLGACATLTALLLWSRMGGDDGVTEVLAHRMEVLPGRFIEVPCSEDYDSHRSFEGCTPRKCGRGISDVVISREEAVQIRSIAEKGLSLGGSDGGASILDLHSGALSVGKHFVNLYRYFGDKIQSVFSEEDFQLYRDVRQKVQLTIAEAFGISASLLYLTKPTFFSRINTTEARTAHDEYWHAHVDKVTYGSFDYTSLLYLSDYLEDFGGGRFVFMEEGANKTVEPRVVLAPNTLDLRHSWREDHINQANLNTSRGLQSPQGGETSPLRPHHPRQWRSESWRTFSSWLREGKTCYPSGSQQ
nr:2-oxoglutarate and iron-dependent oxygenase domain-containing protein 3 isoform X2 [Loxodonta africana]